MTVRLYNINQDSCLASRVELALTFVKRLVGLLGRRELADGSAMYISPCNSVHTVAMRFPIDVMFIDSNYQVIKIMHHMRPNQFSPIIRKAVAVVELPAGTLKASGTKIGDLIKVA
ncbi:MAG: DUF192 domain-containing protein [Bacillota bacterium]